MCYYERIDFRCGDHRWGNMKQQCPRERRIGETCGARLSHDSLITQDPGMCKICRDLEIKRRRQSKAYEDLRRWQRESQKYRATIEKTQAEIRQLDDAIEELHSKRTSVARRL